MFKKLVLGAVAASMMATPMIASEAAAAPQRTVTTTKHYNNHGGYTQRTVVRQSTNHRQWQRGQRFDRRYATNYRELDYRQYRGRHLYAPPRGYHWVRSGNDAVLVAVASGLIGAVIGGALR